MRVCVRVYALCCVYALFVFFFFEKNRITLEARGHFAAANRREFSERIIIEA